MFRANNVNNEQVDMFGKEIKWTKYMEKRIRRGWSGYFHDVIMPSINEEPYRVLYSKDEASCPNTPVNVLIGLLILKPLINMSDENLIDELLFNEKVQYALHTLNMDKQPISKNSLGNFRAKIFNYEAQTGIDLFERTMKELNEKIIELMKIDSSIQRMDSMMISDSCKTMSRTELVYTVNHNFIKMLDKNKYKIPNKLKNYLDEEYRIDILYRTREDKTLGKLETLLDHSLKLYRQNKHNQEIIKTKEFKNLERLIEDQYDSTKGRPKEGKEIKATSLQTPYDEESTYRYKYGSNKGYVGNINEIVEIKEEKRTEKPPMISSWQIEQNIVSDIEMLNKEIKGKEKGKLETKIVDAAYYNEEIEKEAEKVNIKIHPTDLTGQKEIKGNITEFEIKDNQIKKCPRGEEPTETKYNKEKGTITAKFKKEVCEKCDHKDFCSVKIKATMSKVETTEKKIKYQQMLITRTKPEYKAISRIRAGIEGIPSILRNVNKIDRRPVKGKKYLKMQFSSCLISINIKRASKYQDALKAKEEKRIILKYPLMIINNN